MQDIAAWQAQFEQFMQHHDDDGAHDISHLQRVWRNAQNIMRNEIANELVVLAACYFHDFVNLPKNSADRAKASSLSAEQVGQVIRKHFSGFPGELIAEVQHAIAAHSFSANIAPTTIEAKIVQDADRLEALGAIGLMRVFYTAGKMNSQMFDSRDLLAKDRPLDDKSYALDHFQKKLLKIPATMNTETGRRLAEQGADYLREFMRSLSDQLTCE